MAGIFLSFFVLFCPAVGVAGTAVSLRESLDQIETQLDVESDPVHRHGLLQAAGRFHFLLDEYGASEKRFKEALALAPLSDPQAVAAWAMVQNILGDSQSARQTLDGAEAAFEERPSQYPILLDARAAIFRSNNQSELERQSLQKILTVSDSPLASAVAALDLASSYRQAGTAGLALEQLDRASSYAPDDTRTRRRGQILRFAVYKDLSDTPKLFGACNTIENNLAAHEDALFCVSFAGLLESLRIPKSKAYYDIAKKSVLSALSRGPELEDLYAGMSLLLKEQDPRPWLDTLIASTTARPDLDVVRQELLLRRSLPEDLEELVDRRPLSIHALSACAIRIARVFQQKEFARVQTDCSWLLDHSEGYPSVKAWAYLQLANVERIGGHPERSKEFLKQAEQVMAVHPFGFAPLGFPNSHQLRWQLLVRQMQAAIEMKTFGEALKFYSVLQKEYPGQPLPIDENTLRVFAMRLNK